MSDGFHHLGDDVGIQKDHDSKRRGSAGVLSRAWSMAATSSLLSPAWRLMAASASPMPSRSTVHHLVHPLRVARVVGRVVP